MAEQSMQFPQSLLQQSVKEVVESMLSSVDYDALKVQATTEKLIEEILKKMVGLKIPYKVMASAVIAQKLGAGVHNACSAFWDNTQDGLVMFKYENATLFCVVNVFFAAV
ncbi:Tctex-1_family protein [Hexamita inflata]|uniref:Tctex-1 family protein n=1 Tax=Hexamita inflata TaxID=28002 RepID=A0AA86RGL6_9EUKA|nr:Tctex-1 family protein [Hexamita inflata]CAI9914336.1 Tctex-1 family protein [Hexamita inflata]CAI9972332.1 Tctex-1 family protein [Hexamita inflata]CAI9973680.1 Tctex-1 family protein [Hexamita inflata]